MKYINTIYLAWRARKGDDRILVGRLDRTNDSVTFEYIEEGVNKARKLGFNSYPEFNDLHKKYTLNVLDYFSLRIISIERPDRNKVLAFWEVFSNMTDKFDILGFTQGKLPTDNFEFLAEFPLIKSLKFVTDVSGLSHRKIKKNQLDIGDKIRYEYDDNLSQDRYAVKLYKGTLLIGYVKKVHNLVFREANKRQFDISVKAINYNEYINEIFLRVTI